MDILKQSAILDVTGKPFQRNMDATYSGGGFGRELSRWNPSALSADAALLPNLNTLNNRTYDVTRNHGFASSGVQLHIDNIVGHQFKLSYKPNAAALGVKSDALADWAKLVEAKFTAFAEDEECWIDAEQKRTFTMIIREAVGTHTTVGEILASAEWLNNGSPYRTAIKMIDTDRLCNPNEQYDTNRLRGGVYIGAHGEAIGYSIRTGHSSDDRFGGMNYQWKNINKRTRHGRRKILHIFEPGRADQTRGGNRFVSVLKDIKMLQKHQDITLQNAIVNATYAAVIESEMDTESVIQAISSGDTTAFKDYMNLSSAYAEGADIKMDGVRIPHLFPNEKLNLLSPQTNPHTAEFEANVLRKIAAGLNVSYEQLTRDYSKTNYSSARASMLESWKYFMGLRKIIASRFASHIFSLWFEEALDKGEISLPMGSNGDFYRNRSAWTACEWIGQGRTQIDGLKETKEMVLKLEAGLITYEKACAILGEDYQEIFAQQVREMKERKDAGLPPPSYASAELFAPEQQTIPETIAA